ncbi:hypothetical protein Gotri_024278 [Gossypium trilobum]|uniref:Uncharacterized protein n=1 Tax=Gossypium trilobum TaxID=34281 RepID=A0A7J9DLM7_9ROSI|nr:hypothetical protein [Gossypium trilobum]
MAKQFDNFIGKFISYNAKKVTRGYRSFMRVYVRLDVRALLKRRKKIVVPDKWEVLLHPDCSRQTRDENGVGYYSQVNAQMGTTGVRHLLARGGRFGPPHFEEDDKDKVTTPKKFQKSNFDLSLNLGLNLAQSSKIRWGNKENFEPNCLGFERIGFNFNQNLMDFVDDKKRPNVTTTVSNIMDYLKVLLGVGFYLNIDILTALLCRPFLSNETLKLKRPWLEESTSCSSPLAHVKECASPCGVLYGKKLVARRME